MFPAVEDSVGRSRTRARIALALWIVLILVASRDVFSFDNTEALLRSVDPEPVANDRIVELREMIHLIEYGVLGLLAHRALRAPGRGPLAQAATLPLALAICLAVSVSDESLQVFQPHRSGSTGDVALDLIGAGVGIAASLLLLGIARLRRGAREVP